MALLGQVGQVASVFGDALAFASSFTQRQVSISEKPPIPGLNFSVPVVGQNTVILEVTETEDMTLSVGITDKPVADIGAAVDYIARRPPKFTISGIISNTNLDVLADPLGFALSRAGAAAPEIASAINQAVDVGGQFFDLGGDDIDNKIKQLYEWQINAIYVHHFGVRLQINHWLQDTDLINWLIEEINPRHDLDTGDGVGIQIVFKGMIGYSTGNARGQGGILQEINEFQTSLSSLNPFGGI